MSSRALRKLQSKKDYLPQKEEHVAVDKELECGTEEADEEDVDVCLSSRTSGARKKSNKPATQNIFALLNDEEEAVMEDEDNDEALPKVEKESAVTAKTKKKKKKNKNKAKDTVVPNPKPEEDDLDATLREVNELMGGRQNVSHMQNSGRSGEEFGQVQKPVLTVEHRHLNPENEIKRIFGSRVVEKDKIQRRQRGQVVKKTWLVQPKEGWFSMYKTGLSQRLVETKDGLQYFAFEHSKSYQKIQFDFLDAVETLNPENIINILKLYPFHIDALMQVSEIYKMSDDLQGAVEMIERVLYVFETSFHPLFSLTTGTSRLDYRYNENRSFFLALFHHLTAVGRRGCWRTALEFCKLLLSLDPDNDPLCVLLMIDFYALRSQQHAFLVRLFEEWEGHRNLSLLPNFAFSVPLAMYHMSNAGECSLEKANEMLQESLIMFPGLLFPLLDKCSVAPDSVVQKHGFFTSKAQTSQSVELQQLIQLYVGRCNSCWKEAGVMLWLETNVKQVLERVDRMDSLVENCAKKRSKMYRGTPRNIHRHVIISEIKEALSCLPPEVRLSPILSHDPLPPLDAISSYHRPPKPPRTAQQQGNPLSMFFQSLLPSFDPQNPGTDSAEGAVGGAPAGTDLRHSVGALVDAMRHLLDGIRFMPHPVENGAQENGVQENGAANEDENDRDHDDEWN